MIKTHKTDDFEVGNIHCFDCGENLYFSHQHSDSYNVVFYCANESCDMSYFMVRYEETDSDMIIIEKM